MKKLLFLSASFLLWSSLAYAQNNDEQDIFTDVNQQQDNSDSQSTTTVKRPAAKPFIRMVLPVDSITMLVTYTEIIEQSESLSDSLYKRAKRWAMANFAKNGEKPKDIFEVDKENAKLVINGYIDAYTYTNKYSKLSVGYHKFKMTLWIKEGRYKYTISNLVNESKITAGDKNTIPTKTYFEYYNTTSTNVKNADAVLRGADADLKRMIEVFKKLMKDPIIVDEDDW
jgi:hypothetical protein